MERDQSAQSMSESAIDIIGFIVYMFCLSPNVFKKTNAKEKRFSTFPLCSLR